MESIQKESKEEESRNLNYNQIDGSDFNSDFVDNSQEAIQMRQFSEQVDSSEEMQELSGYQEQINSGKEKKNNTGIPDNIKKGIEAISGISLDDVRVYYNSLKPEEIDAHAYAEGNNVYIASGQEEHLPHELWHIVQQKDGLVKATGKVKGKKVNEKENLEADANKKAKEVRGLPKENKETHSAPLRDLGSPSENIAQMVKLGDPSDMSDGWTNILDTTGDWMAYIRSGEVCILIPKRDFDDTIPDDEKINNIGKMDVGCSLCVLADYYGENLKDFIKRIFQSGVQKDIDYVKEIMQNGASASVEGLFKSLNVWTDLENFDNYAVLMHALETNDTDWTGALMWEGHVIRAKGASDGTISFWDPQSGASESAIPKSEKLYLVTFV
jgi:hypothetical protein